jgi:hypothetical protein
MSHKASRKTEVWFSNIMESLKEKNSGRINCCSRLEPRNTVCIEIERIVEVKFKKSGENKHEQKL